MVDESKLIAKLDEVIAAIENVSGEIPTAWDIEEKLDTIIILLKKIALK